MYLIVKDEGFGQPLSYFSIDSFWPLREYATRFASREAAEAHIVVIAKGDAMFRPITDPSFYSVVPA